MAVTIRCSQCGEPKDGLLDYENHMRDHEYVDRCPACGDPIDYCQGHGMIGDPMGRFILRDHDEGEHGKCSPTGCSDAMDKHLAAWGEAHPPLSCLICGNGR